MAVGVAEGEAVGAVAVGIVVDVVTEGALATVVDVVDVEVVVAGSDGADAAHVEAVITFESRVTAPLRASSRPSTVVRVCAPIEVRAITVPAKVVSVPSVAELPICQKTLHADASPTRATVALEAVMSVSADWKMKTASGSPRASSVTVPVRLRVAPEYTPGTSVSPPRLTIVRVVERPAASL